jgi:hypothetical protein
MARLLFEPNRTRLRFVGLVGLGLFLCACGGGGHGTIGSGSKQPPQTGPNAILNGPALATAASHWTSAKCNVQVELTSDSGFYSIVVDAGGKTSSGPEKWAIGPDSSSVIVGPGSGLGGFFWVSELRSIAGSSSSQIFTANVIVQPNTQILGSCPFALVQGKLS